MAGLPGKEAGCFLLRPLSPPVRRGLRVALPVATPKLVTGASAAGNEDIALFPVSHKKRMDNSFQIGYEEGCRDVAQLGRALRSGRRSRAFKSRHPDHFFIPFSQNLRIAVAVLPVP
jgi:hypothetical protein